MSTAIYTFKNLQDQVLQWLDETSNADTTLANVKEAINQAQQLRLQTYKWPFLLWPQVETLAVTTAARIYAIHPMAARLESLFNPTTQRYIVEMPHRQLPTFQQPTTTQTPASYFRMAGTSHVAAQPGAATTIRIVSSDAADDGASWTVILKGVVSGAYVEETLEANGTSQVTSTNSFSTILSVTKVGTWAGTLTVSTTGGTTLLVLTSGERGRQYPLIEFLQTPDADSLQYRFYRMPIKLENDHDIPDIPAPYSQILVWDVLLQFAAYNQDADPKAVAVWKDNRDRWAEALDQAFQEGQTLEATTRTIRYVNDAVDVPRAFRFS